MLQGIDKVVAAKVPLAAATKALGDVRADLVYTPVTPCRIVDTRLGAGGILNLGDTRNWLASNPGGTFATQGGSNSDCGIPVRPAAAMMNITIANTGVAPSFISAWPFNQPRPNASTVNWTSVGAQIANAVIVPLCTGVGCTADFSVYAASSTDVIVDVTGYFAAPRTLGLEGPPVVRAANGDLVGPFVPFGGISGLGVFWRSPYGVVGIRLWLDEEFGKLNWGSGLYPVHFVSPDCSGPGYVGGNIAPLVAVNVENRLWLYKLDPSHPRGPLPITFDVGGQGQAWMRSPFAGDSCMATPVSISQAFVKLDPLMDIKDAFVRPFHLE